MKKVFISLVLVFQTLFLFAQLNLENTTIKGSTVIKPTFNNLVSLAKSGFAEFKSAMVTNNYQLTTDGTGYCAKSLYFTYIIQKETGSMLWAFANDDFNLVSNLRSQIKSKYPSAIAAYEQGFEIYRLKLTDGTKIKIALQEQNDGFASVAVYLM